MTDRYSPSDLQVYGAADDFEMDMIVAAIDRGLEEPKPAEISRSDAGSDSWGACRRGGMLGLVLYGARVGNAAAKTV